MSYSVCLECKSMVPGYQKYCPKCEYNKKENIDYYSFWKSHGYEFYQEPLRTQELKKDALNPNLYKKMGEM